MRPILATLVLLWQTPASASSTLASTFGYNTTNATSAFQAAVGSANDTIIIDLQSADWNVGPSSFFDLTNKTLIFQPGVVLRALPGVFNSSGACLLRFRRCSNITVIGYGAEFIMNKPEYALLNDSEWRHTLKLDNCSGVVVKGLTLRDSGGDGIYVGGEIMAGSTINYSENVLIEDIRAINHYRQGMSITSVQNMLVRHCLFTGTNGTLPESGVDIEPYLTYQRIIGLVFEKCSFTDNDHCGIQVSMWEMDDTSLPIDITFRDCYIAENGRPGHPYGPDPIDLSDDDTPLTGNVLFERCHVDSSQWTAVNVRKPATSYNALFTDCAFTNVSQQQILYNTPIWVEVSDYGAPCTAFGGVQFANCLLTYDTQFPYLQCNGWNTSPGPQNVGFSGLVVGPKGAGVNITNSADTLNCLFVANEVDTAPPTTVGYALDQAPAEECGATPIRFDATRTAADISYPLPCRYDTSGTVGYGNDAHLMTGSLMIPPNALSANDTILARWDDLNENTEEVIIAPLTSAVYTNSQYRSTRSTRSFSALLLRGGRPVRRPADATTSSDRPANVSSRRRGK